MYKRLRNLSVTCCVHGNQICCELASEMILGIQRLPAHMQHPLTNKLIPAARTARPCRCTAQSRLSTQFENLHCASMHECPDLLQLSYNCIRIANQRCKHWRDSQSTKSTPALSAMRILVGPTVIACAPGFGLHLWH